MPCFHPLKGWKNTTGGIQFSRQDAVGLMEVPCGQCIGCRLERSRQWAIRCVHEASLHDDNCFITLTYADPHLPPGGTLQKADFQKFMKRLRKRYAPQKIRFYHCGEYGSNLGRPHYHACLFGFDFPDKKPWTTRQGLPVYRSPALEELWSLGNSEIGTVTFESAAYVARYIMKKVTGVPSENHYSTVDLETGEVSLKSPEYTTMSRRPGIGIPFLQKYQEEMYPHDEVIVRGKKMRPPRSYDIALAATTPEMMDIIKEQRRRKAKKAAADNTEERLRDKEQVTEAKTNLFPRNSI